jgi:tetratricopeptide (TPR) repeat protein
MASVFLSYDRDDADKARPLALALEKAGHSVWWDLHVRGGAQFSRVIEEALRAADVVVVLWSANSVESAWVRDEAAAGRDSGRLVPVTIDDTEPPLGFRQFQSIDLSNWKGRGKPAQLQSLLADVEALAGTGPTDKPSTCPPPTPRPVNRFPSHQLIGGLAALAIAVALAGALIWRPWVSEPSAVVAISAADPSRASQDYARNLLANLGQLQSAKPGTLELVGPNERKRADLVFEVAGSADGQQARANLVLIAAKRRGLLWSKSFERPTAKSGDLREELGYAAAQVLQCAIEAHPNGRAALKAEVLKLYLNGCAEFGDPNLPAISNLIHVFRRVTVAAPKFERGWAKLLLAEDEAYAGDQGGAEAERLERDLRRDIASARKLSPDMPEVYVAEIALLPFDAFRQRLELADRGISLSPDNSQLLVIRSGLRQAVGRVSDALDDARQAAELDPISQRTRQWYIASLAASGRTEAALKELEEVESIWPGSSSVANARFALHLRYGDPRIAWRSIQSGETAAGWIGAKNFLQARLDPTSANVSRAIKDARTFYAKDYSTLHHLVQVLSILNRDDGLLPLLMSVPLDHAAYVTDVTFRPAAREFWHDPRALAYAERVGLLQYWQASGKWPDFCDDTDLPYDCKKEAAKLIP